MAGRAFASAGPRSSRDRPCSPDVPDSANRVRDSRIQAGLGAAQLSQNPCKSGTHDPFDAGSSPCPAQTRNLAAAARWGSASCTVVTPIPAAFGAFGAGGAWPATTQSLRIPSPSASACWWRESSPAPTRPAEITRRRMGEPMAGPVARFFYLCARFVVVMASPSRGRVTGGCWRGRLPTVAFSPALESSFTCSVSSPEEQSARFLARVQR